jgi:hypothetical protein
MASIRNIERRGDKTYLRYGKTEIEVSGGMRGLREWVRDNQPTDEQAIAMILKEHFKSDADARDLSPLKGRELAVAVKEAG